MKKNIEEITKEDMAQPNDKLISRKQAIKKSVYIAVSAATMMILLSSPNSAKAVVSSPAAPGDFG